MIALHPQYIKDSNGNTSMVVLPLNEFKSIVEDLEDLEDIKSYDEAKNEDTGDRILFSDYLKNRKENNA